MRRIAVRDLAPGHRLSAPVTAAGGVVLVQAGTELTEPVIARLADLGVDSVLVASPPGADSAEDVSRRAAEVEARFEGHESNLWMMALKRIVLDQLAPGAADQGDA
jgi:hypothetical protein